MLDVPTSDLEKSIAEGKEGIATSTDEIAAYSLSDRAQDHRADKESITKFEIMDGQPVRGQFIPVRMCLSDTDLTPSHRNVQNKSNVKYVLSVNEENR